MAYAIPDYTRGERVAIRRPPEAAAWASSSSRSRTAPTSSCCARRRAARTWSARRSTGPAPSDILGTVAGDDTLLRRRERTVGGAAGRRRPRRPRRPLTTRCVVAVGVSDAWEEGTTCRSELCSRTRVGWTRRSRCAGCASSGTSRWSRARSTSASSKPGEDEAIHERARAAGAVEVEVIDARAEFAQNILVPALRANALYEGKYPLVSALSRPVIVEHLVASARRHRADAVGHGCTGKGNDQVRFEVSSRILAPDLEVLAPVRVWGLTRADCVELAAQVGDPDRGDGREAVLDRREHVGPRHRVRRAREPVGVAAGGAVHAHSQRRRTRPPSRATSSSASTRAFR